MPGPVIVALDGSDKDGRGIAVATAIARLAARDVHLVRVIGDPLAGTARDPQREVVGLRVGEAVQQAVSQDRTEAETQLAALAAELAVPHGAKATWAVLQANDVGDALMDHVRERDGLVLIMSTRAPGVGSRALLGSVADRVMRESARPVVLVPPGAAFLSGKEPTIARVLVPLDDSSLSFRSIEFAIELPKAAQLEYVLIEVVPDAHAGETAETRLAATATWLRSRGATRVETHVIQAADVPKAILEAVRSSLVDAIVMSTRGAGGFKRLLLGSVAEQVVRGSEIPVLLLTPRVLSPD